MYIVPPTTDFQFKQTRIDAKEIYENVKDTLPEGATIYIATDERDKKFFGPLREHYNILLMDDFKDELAGVNKNFFGMIGTSNFAFERLVMKIHYLLTCFQLPSYFGKMTDQLVASRGRMFFGCWHST